MQEVSFLTLGCVYFWADSVRIAIVNWSCEAVVGSKHIIYQKIGTTSSSVEIWKVLQNLLVCFSFAKGYTKIASTFQAAGLRQFSRAFERCDAQRGERRVFHLKISGILHKFASLCLEKMIESTIKYGVHRNFQTAFWWATLMCRCFLVHCSAQSPSFFWPGIHLSFQHLTLHHLHLSGLYCRPGSYNGLALNYHDFEWIFIGLIDARCGWSDGNILTYWNYNYSPLPYFPGACFHRITNWRMSWLWADYEGADSLNEGDGNDMQWWPPKVFWGWGLSQSSRLAMARSLGGRRSHRTLV